MADNERNNTDNSIDEQPPAFIEATGALLRVCQILGMILVLTLMLLTVTHVSGRYLFKHPLIGVVEISSLMVLTLVFLTGPYNFLIDRHIKVDMILERLSVKTRIIIEFFMHCLALITACLAFWGTLRQSEMMIHSGQTTDILRIPYYPFYYVTTFGWALCVVAILTRMLKFFIQLKAVQK
ncbi:TRAP transporter small permease [Moorella sulfitireducens]|uniref:TRAP transporter small permease n=1 Tax=Neomoorella sulfitireducens TaxID=2972948 RepID=UPI0021ABF358|nr:TRAP transporter small permease [Moorella sulfitireducens]